MSWANRVRRFILDHRSPQQRKADSYRLDGWEEPINTEHFARDPQYPIEKLDQEFRLRRHGDPTL